VNGGLAYRPNSLPTLYRSFNSIILGKGTSGYYAFRVVTHNSKVMDFLLVAQGLRNHLFICDCSKPWRWRHYIPSKRRE